MFTIGGTSIFIPPPKTQEISLRRRGKAYNKPYNGKECNEMLFFKHDMAPAQMNQQYL